MSRRPLIRKLSSTDAVTREESLSAGWDDILLIAIVGSVQAKSKKRAAGTSVEGAERSSVRYMCRSQTPRTDRLDSKRREHNSRGVYFPGSVLGKNKLEQKNLFVLSCSDFKKSVGCQVRSNDMLQ